MNRSAGVLVAGQFRGGADQFFGEVERDAGGFAKTEAALAEIEADFF